MSLSPLLWLSDLFKDVSLSPNLVGVSLLTDTSRPKLDVSLLADLLSLNLSKTVVRASEDLLRLLEFSPLDCVEFVCLFGLSWEYSESVFEP